MKRILYSMLTLAALGALAWLSVDIASVVHARKAVNERIKQLPRIELVSLDGRRMSTAAKYRRPTILLFFRTTCPFCREEISDLVAHHAMFDEAAVLLISAEKPGVLKRFADELEIEQQTDFTVAIDEKGELARHYGIRKIPALFVYDREGQFLWRNDGLVRAPAIAAVVKKAGHGRIP